MKSYGYNPQIWAVRAESPEQESLLNNPKGLLMGLREKEPPFKEPTITRATQLPQTDTGKLSVKEHEELEYYHAKAEKWKQKGQGKNKWKNNSWVQQMS